MMLSRDIKVTRGSILEEVLQVYKESEDVHGGGSPTSLLRWRGRNRYRWSRSAEGYIFYVLGKSIQDLFHRGKCVCSFPASSKAT